ncbi:MAG: hypothetical protein SFV17_02545 [Candidatus Obscuribacter sp.]|nr:hypothetical protein [Candidatus Obscuribacter sp.]
MAREDKGSAAGSYQDTASGKSGEQDTGSLAARRARLRGTLSKQITPPDPYQPSPSETYQPSSPSPLSTEAKESEDPASVGAESEESVPEGHSKSGNGTAASGLAESASTETGADDSPFFAAGSGKSMDFDTSHLFKDDDDDLKDAGSTAIPVKKAKDQTQIDEKQGENLAQKQAPIPEKVDSPTSAAPVPVLMAPTVVNVDNPQVVELLNNLDQQLGICSVNLSQIAKAANEQLDLVRNLSETIQHQAFGEIGLSLNSLSESLSAALEPMKAVGELVPAIDTLVTTIGTNAEADRRKAEEVKEDTRHTPEMLVTSLADQLAAGRIDPWTFKCAYMAVFPTEHPADLLRKLVDLLGTQKLSGDLFRAAYDAVQAPDPPKPVYNYQQAAGPNPEGVTEVRYVQDEAVLAKLEELRKANEELKGRMDQRELEFSELLQSKEQEVAETQEMLNSRWEDFSGRYEQLSEMVRERNEELQKKETELARIQAEKDLELARLQSDRDLEMSRVQSEIANKDTEISQLKSQLEEMRDQTKDMVADLQRQLTSTKLAVEEAARLSANPPPKPQPQPGFFESVASQSNTGNNSNPAASLFNSEPSAGAMFNASESGSAAAAPQVVPVPAPVPVPVPVPVPTPVPTPAVSASIGATSQALGGSASVMGSAPDPIVPSPNPAVAAAAAAAAAGQAIPRPQVAAPTTPFPGSPGSYGSGVRAQVFEVIVRQALAGAPWREICAGPMSVNGISPDEVEGEVKRRQALLKK